MAVNHLEITNRVAVVRDYAALWQQFFTFFADDLKERTFTQAEEEEFASLVSILSLNHYKFQELSKDYFKDAPEVVKVLEQAVSLEHLKEMADAKFSKLQVDWHTLFIGMNKALGKIWSEIPPKKLAEMQAAEGAEPRG